MGELERAYEKRRRKLLYSIFIVALIFLGGTIGYMLIEGWDLLKALFVTAITISTVGYEIPSDISRAGRIFTMFLILSGITGALYGLTNLTAFIVEGEVMEVFKKRRMMKMIASFKDHYVVIGVGRVGRYVVRELVRSNSPVVIIDNNETAIKNLMEELDRDIPYILGDATLETTLSQANLAAAKAMVTTLPEDSQNVLVVLTAKWMNPNLNVVSIARETSNISKLLYAGADNVISPAEIAGTRIATTLLHPGLTGFLDVVSRTEGQAIKMESVEVPADSPMANLTLEKARIPQKTGLIIISIRKGNRSIFNPGKETLIEPGDELFVLGHPDKIKKLKTMVTGEIQE